MRHNFLSPVRAAVLFHLMRVLCWPLLALGFAGLTAKVEGAANPLRRSRQCVVVLADGWDSKTGVLRAFERSGAHDEWKPHGGNVPVVLGKQGLAWGLGLTDTSSKTPRKMEGDNKVPAGLFEIGPAFGYAPAGDARWIKLKYVTLTEQTEGIDDPHSRFYNQLVDRSRVARVDWHSSEQMRRKDDLYKWGAFVAHNASAVPGAGSCIFLHIWRNSSSPTAGCTAMPEQDLVNLLRWMDPSARPVLVQMPHAEYAGLRSRYGLPAIGETATH